MNEFKWCQRCGGVSNGKEFCLDCQSRLRIHSMWKASYRDGDTCRAIGVKNFGL